MKRARVIVFLAALVLLALYLAPMDDPALPEVVYDRDGVAYLQDGTRIEEDMPQWDCETMGNRQC